MGNVNYLSDECKKQKEAFFFILRRIILAACVLLLFFILNIYEQKSKNFTLYIYFFIRLFLLKIMKNIF